MSTFGPSFEEKHDGERINEQRARILALMLDGEWRTLTEIEARTTDPQASISAQLRHLRKDRFGAYTVERRTKGDRKNGLYEYRLLPPRKYAVVSKPCPRCGGCGSIDSRVYEDA